MKILLLLLGSLLAAAEAKLPAPKCLTGEYHLKKPGPETGDYKACHLYKSNTCCTAKFTQQLENYPINAIGNFSWKTCGTLSKTCTDYMREVECFYQCSPNVGYWKGPYKGSFQGVPLCSKFCNDWYDACRTESWCARNWITDFTRLANGTNKCKQKCRPFTDVYSNGQDLCENLWGTSFKYVISKSPNDCMHLNSNSSDVISMNTKVAEKYKSIDSGARWLRSYSFLAMFLFSSSFMALNLLMQWSEICC